MLIVAIAGSTLKDYMASTHAGTKPRHAAVVMAPAATAIASAWLVIES